MKCCIRVFLSSYVTFSLLKGHIVPRKIPMNVWKTIMTKYSTRINQFFEYDFCHLLVQCPVKLVLYPGYLGCYIDKKIMTVNTAFTVRVLNSVLCPCRVTLSCHSSLSGGFISSSSS